MKRVNKDYPADRWGFAVSRRRRGHRPMFQVEIWNHMDPLILFVGKARTFRKAYKRAANEVESYCLGLEVA